MDPRAEDSLLQFFRHDHLRDDLKPTVRSFQELAQGLVATLPRNPERTVALRKLLEAKDCAVRAHLFEHNKPEAAQAEPDPRARGPRW
jgi:ferritin-like protein